ncbi:MAG: M24 family metallopeptidase [Brevinema sp.]
MLHEYAVKKTREYLFTKGFDGVLLGKRTSFAWFSGGESSMNFYSEMGLGFIWITQNEAFAYCSNNEALRIEKEIFNSSFPVKSFSWVEGPGSNLQNLIKGKKVLSDFPLPNATEDFNGIKRLRLQLSPEQIKIAENLSQRAAKLLEDGVKNLKAGMSEFQIQAEIRKLFDAENIALPVLLVAGDEDLKNYRHPLATAKSVNKKVMVVICAIFQGVEIAATRLRYFSTPTQEDKRLDEAVASINAEMIAATKVGTHASQLWQNMLSAYKNQGFEQEYLNHHQGGAIGFDSREWILRPNLDETVLENQLFAWNPTLTGTKSEETVIASSSPKVLTITGNYPTLEHKGITITLPLF